MKTKLIIILTLFFCEISIAQEDYLIFNVVVEDSYTHTGSINNSFWILKIEDIDNIKVEYEILPLYLLRDLSKDAVEDCLSNQEIDLFTTTVDTNRNFEKYFIIELKGLELLLKEKIRFQKITKKWKNKRKSKVTIYVTPIRGLFDECKANSAMKKKFNISEKIVIPNSNFTLLDFEILERDDIADFLFYADFSKYSFANRVW